MAQPAEVRQRFVRDACGDDESLRRELESLRGYVPAATPFLETPAAESCLTPRLERSA